MKYTIDFEQHPKAEDTQILCDGISENAKIIKGHKPVSFFAFFIRDGNGKIVGGCNGDILYGQLYVGQLWVDEKLRHQGYGTQLMMLAEKHAKETGSRFMSVNTMDLKLCIFTKNSDFMLSLSVVALIKILYFIFYERIFKHHNIGDKNA